MNAVEPQNYAVYLAGWGAALSTVLFAIKLWESFWKDRIKIESTYLIAYGGDNPHRITTANMSSVPIQVSNAELYWVPNFFPLNRPTPRIATPDSFYTASAFRIDGHSPHVFMFEGEERFDVSSSTTSGRKLYLYLHIFGRKRPKKLMIFKPDNWQTKWLDRCRRKLSRFP